MADLQELRHILSHHRELLLAMTNVVGCGVGLKEVRGRPTRTSCIVTFVEKKLPLDRLPARARVPQILGGAPTDVIEIGRVRLLSQRTERMRPAQPGVSIGHNQVSAGTFGAVVYDARSGEPLILSNNHVLANTSDGRDERAQEGDPILQPGRFDGGGPDDVIGHLTRFEPIHPLTEAPTCPIARRAERIGNRLLHLVRGNYNLQFVRRADTSNLVDAAVARPTSPNVINPEILGIGNVRGVEAPEPGMRVRKSGRTTGVNSGTIRTVSTTLDVHLGDAGIARFEDQVVTTAMAEPGDSGSAGITEANRIFGLLFAGSDTATIYNRAEHVAELLGIRFTA